MQLYADVHVLQQIWGSLHHWRGLRLLLPLVLHGIFDGATGGSSLLLREIPTCPYFQLYCDVVIDGDGYQRAKLNEGTRMNE